MPKIAKELALFATRCKLTYDLFINTGLGISFNRGGFRFSVELKNSYVLFDVLKKEGNIYTDGIQSIKSNIVQLSIVFD